MKKKTQLVLGFFFLSFSLSAQVSGIQAELDKINRRINIFYNLQAKGGKYDKFEVEVYLSQDSGKTYPHKLEVVTGNVGKEVSPGVNRKLVWLYVNEGIDFTGQGAVFKIRAKVDKSAQERRILALGGPKEALLSAVVPGWGDYKVRDGKRWGFFGLGLASYGMLGTGLFLRNRANNNFDQIDNSQSAEEAQNLLDKADNQNTVSTILINTGIAVWALDLAFALLKGRKNRRNQQLIRQKDKSTSLRFGLDPYATTPTFGLNFKF
ncbi:MAG: hypothetical protein AAFU64_05230 [Bacteroidota bacterium]